LGLGNPDVSALDIVEGPVELERGESFGGGIGEVAANVVENENAKRAQVRDLDGRLWTWGLSDEGQSGTGIHSIFHDGPRPPILESPQAIAGALADAWITSFNATFPGALDRRGRVWQWGRNRYGANGNGVPSDQVLPTPADVPVPIGIFTASGIFRKLSLAVSADGRELWAWGDIPISIVDRQTRESKSGPCNIRVGTGFHNCAPLLLLENGLEGHPIRDVVTTHSAAFFLDSQGRLWQWGQAAGQPLVTEPTLMDVTPLNGAKVVGLGITRSFNGHVIFVLDEFGGIWAQGGNTRGVPGTGSHDDYELEEFQRVAFPSEAGRIVEMAATEDFVLALDENHCFWAWGQNLAESGNPRSDPGGVFPDAIPRFSVIIAPISVLQEHSPSSCPPVAARPNITSTPELDIIQGGSYVYQIEIDNPNDFPVEFQLEEAPSGMMVDSDSGLVEWPVPEVGTHTVELKVMDTRGLFGTQQFVLRVAPETFEIDSAPPASVTQNSLFKYQPSISGSTTGLEYQLIDGPADMRLVFGTRIEWVADEVGEHFVSILATNALGQTATQQFTLNVSPRPGTEQLSGEVLGLFAERTVLLQDFETGQHFELKANGSFSIGPFNVGESYRLNVYHSYQFCWVQEGGQGVVQEGVDESIVIECEQSSPSGTEPSEPFKAGSRRDDSAGQ